MQFSKLIFKTSCVFLFVFMVGQLGACKLGSSNPDSNSGNTADNLAESDPDLIDHVTPPEVEVIVEDVPEINITFGGSVGDGPVIGATINIYDKNDNLIETEVSNSSALFDVNFMAKEDLYPLKIKVIGGIDLVTWHEPDFTLMSVIFNPQKVNLNINPFTTFIVKIASNLPGGLTEDNVSIAQGYVLQQLNFGFNQNIIAEPFNTAVTDSNVAVIVKASEALGEVVRRTRDALKPSVSSIHGNDVVDMLVHDLVDGTLDGILDGIGDGIGAGLTDFRASKIASIISAQVLIESLTNSLYVEGVLATETIDNAIIIANPNVTSNQLTAYIPANQKMIDQAKLMMAEALIVNNSIEFQTISAALTDIKANSLAADNYSILPIEYSQLLSSVISEVMALDDATLKALYVPNPTEPGVEPSTPIESIISLSGVPDISVEQDQKYVFLPVAFDAESDPLTFSIVNKPAWTSFDPGTGMLTGTPTSLDVGVYSSIGISVTDGTHIASIAPFDITVKFVNTAPVISGIALASMNAESAYSFQPVASDADGDTLSFQIQNQPLWTVFSSSTGKLSGTPVNVDANIYTNIIISVSDGTDTATLAPFNITVNKLNTAPVISGVAMGSVVSESLYNFQPVASDIDGDTLSFQIENKPLWAQFSATTGKLSGTPTNTHAGIHNNITISVSDGTTTTALPPFSITVNKLNTAPVISGTGMGSLLAESNYNFQPVASDIDGDTLSFQIQNKPVWAEFSATTGNLSGMPNNTDAGSYDNIIISVSDAAQSTSLAAFSIVVVKVNHPPTISGTPETTATVEVNYIFSPSATDVDGDKLIFSVSNLPVWAAFDNLTGKVSGIPTNADAGLYENILVSVTDGLETVSLTSFSIQITAVVANTSTATLTWDAPTSRVSGGAMAAEEIGGYIVYYGITEGDYANSLVIDGNVTTTVVNNLSSGTYYFVVSTVDVNGIESDYSNVAFITFN